MQGLQLACVGSDGICYFSLGGGGVLEFKCLILSAYWTKKKICLLDYIYMMVSIF